MIKNPVKLVKTNVKFALEITSVKYVKPERLPILLKQILETTICSVIMNVLLELYQLKCLSIG